MLRAVLHIDPDNSMMKSKTIKEGQMIFGKTVINILKDTLRGGFELIDRSKIQEEGGVIFFMGNVPLLTLKNIHADLRQYPDDIIFFKDEREKPLALYVDEKTLSKNLDLIKGDWLDFSTLLTELACPYRVEILNSTLCIFTKQDVHEVSRKIQKVINNKLVDAGVTFIDVESTYVDFDVKVGMDTVIYPNTFLRGQTVIGEDCVIGPDARIDDSSIGDRTSVKDSTIIESSVAHDTAIGPYAYLRPKSVVGSHVKVGDFVELKNAQIGDNSKISHLSYVGDAEVGQHVNIGCGVVFSNYDGKKKSVCKVGDHSFIGCNVNLIAPVEVEALAYVAAGTTVTKRVPSGALAVGRAKQENKEGWVERKKLISEK